MELKTFLLYITSRQSLVIGLPTVSNTAHSNDISAVKQDKATNAPSPDPYSNAGSQTYTNRDTIAFNHRYTLVTSSLWIISSEYCRRNLIG